MCEALPHVYHHYWLHIWHLWNCSDICKQKVCDRHDIHDLAVSPCKWIIRLLRRVGETCRFVASGYVYITPVLETETFQPCVIVSTEKKSCLLFCKGEDIVPWK